MKNLGFRVNFETMREEILDIITKDLKDLPGQSLDLSNAKRSCRIEYNGGEPVVALGVELDDDLVIISVGVYEKSDEYYIEDLYFDTLLDFFDTFSEAIENNPKPYVSE